MMVRFAEREALSREDNLQKRTAAGFALAAMLAAGAATAQQTPPANPLDAIPDQVPLNVPYGAPKAFETGVQGGFIHLMTLDDLIASRGGVPLIEGGKLIGAIGVSGGTGSQDEVAAKAGAALIM